MFSFLEITPVLLGRVCLPGLGGVLCSSELGGVLDVALASEGFFVCPSSLWGCR